MGPACSGPTTPPSTARCCARARQGMRLGALSWLLGQLPLWLQWYAEQPWPGTLLLPWNFRKCSNFPRHELPGREEGPRRAGCQNPGGSRRARPREAGTRAALPAPEEQFERRPVLVHLIRQLERSLRAAGLAMVSVSTGPGGRNLPGGGAPPRACATAPGARHRGGRRQPSVLIPDPGEHLASRVVVVGDQVPGGI